MVLQQTPVLACNVQCEGGSPPRAFLRPHHHHREGSLKTRHPYLRFLCYFLFKSSSPLCEKPGLAFRDHRWHAQTRLPDHHWLAQARKLCLRFLCYLLFNSSFLPSVRNQDWPSGITTGSHKLANYAFVSFATFCLSPLFSLCEKPGLAFRDHHGLAQTRKLCVRFPLLASVQVLFSPSVRNQDPGLHADY